MNASMETVQALLVGSERINQMKTEINSIVRIVFGFITKDDIKRHFKDEGSVCQFQKDIEVGVFRICRAGKSLQASFRITKDNYEYYRFERGYTFLVGQETHPLPLLFVEAVYACLPDFLSNMYKLFPDLESRLAPLFKAAGK